MTGSGFSEEAVNKVIFLGTNNDNNDDDAEVAGLRAAENGTRIELTVPEEATSGKVKIFTHKSEVTSVGSLTVRSPLRTSEQELFGYSGGELEITGEGFSASSKANNQVFFSRPSTDDVELNILEYTSTRLLVRLPSSGLSDGTIKISVGASTVLVPFELLRPRITRLTSEQEVAHCTSSEILCLREGNELVIHGSLFDTNGNNEVIFLGAPEDPGDDRTLTKLTAAGSEDRLEVRVPAGAKSGPIKLKVYATEAQARQTLKILQGPPVPGASIDGIQPQEGIIGHEVVITGKFSPTFNSVEFKRADGSYVQASNIQTVSGREIRATIPEEAVSGTLRVTPRSTKPLVIEEYKLLLALSVRLFPEGYLGEPLQVRGTGFTDTNLSWNQVRFSTEAGTPPDAPGRVTSVTGLGGSIETLVVEVPGKAVSGPVNITVHDSQTSSSFTLTKPRIASLSPTTLFSGEEVEIRGSGFSQKANNRVLFIGREDDPTDDVEVPGLTAEDYTEDDREENERQVLRLNIPEDARSGRLAVKIFNSSAETEQKLDITGAPPPTKIVIRNFSPTRVRLGDKLTIQGVFSDGTSNRVEFS